MPDLMPLGAELPRCRWVGSDPLLAAYHDQEWGRPCHDDRALFERLMLEAFQAGLSWRTILAKRAAFARAFAGWDPALVAAFGPADEARLLADAGIVRNRRKIAAAPVNARAFLAIQAESGSFDRYLWGWAEQIARRARPPLPVEIPTRTPPSDALAADLRRRGFAGLGSTTVYAFLQSVGLVNDHQAGCFMAGI